MDPTTPRSTATAQLEDLPQDTTSPPAQTYRPNNNNNNHPNGNNNNPNTAPMTGSNTVPVNPKGKSTVNCYECGVVGHYSNECPKKLARIAANTAAPAQQQRRFAVKKNPNNRNGRLYHMSATEAHEAPQAMPKENRVQIQIRCPLGCTQSREGGENETSIIPSGRIGAYRAVVLGRIWRATAPCQGHTRSVAVEQTWKEASTVKPREVERHAGVRRLRRCHESAGHNALRPNLRMSPVA
ncbi:hypothetical protein QYE76_041976 [Lolium multiflorum]|uniref:CCHC-type domain-containing protein n=1 Tax=Lolium multiflorum TaxID=4521 RepID=A0AAD8TGB6_LOLMU|nr:hypothetical protein QYE76_041976 [Lolium multiflorum]